MLRVAQQTLLGDAMPETTATRWHRPLLWVSAAMAALAVISAIGLVVDPRELVGAPAWAKPLKFALSVGVYCVTLSWLIGLLPRFKRAGWWLGTVAAAFLLVEIVVIVGAVAFNTTSHFNVTTPFHTAVWAVMAVSIVLVWVAAIPIVIVLLRSTLGDEARTIAIRAGFVLALVGMALAFFMTSPTAEQLSNYQGIAGAHSVGTADGGPGLPLLGWSTVGGDLRVPHFLGMHALQVLPLAAFALERLASTVRVLNQRKLRARLMWIFAIVYAGALVILTGQALAGESVVRPGAAVIVSTALLLAGAAIAIGASVTRAGSSAHPARARVEAKI